MAPEFWGPGFPAHVPPEHSPKPPFYETALLSPLENTAKVRFAGVSIRDGLGPDFSSLAVFGLVVVSAGSIF